MHLTAAIFPPLPAAQGAVDERGGGRLRKPGGLAGGADFCWRWVARRAAGPAAVWMDGHQKWLRASAVSDFVARTYLRARSRGSVSPMLGLNPQYNSPPWRGVGL